MALKYDLPNIMYLNFFNEKLREEKIPISLLARNSYSYLNYYLWEPWFLLRVKL